MNPTRPLTSLLLFALLGCTITLQAQQAKQVTLYSDDFKGNQATYGPGQYPYMTLVRDGLSVIRSAKVPAGLKVTLYQQDNFTGPQLVLTQDANMAFITGKGFGDLQQNTSVVVAIVPKEVAGPHITLYKDNFSGASWQLGPGNYDVADLGDVGNDQLSSVTIPKGLKVTLYEHGGFQGRKLELTQDASASDLVKNKFNDAASSLQVTLVEEAKPAVAPVVVVPAEVKPDKPQPAAEVNAPVVVVYQGDFNGAEKRLRPGRYDAADLGIGNNELSSLDVAQGLRITLYDKEGFKGRALRLTQRTSTQELTDKGFNNITSSAVVEEIPRVTVFEGNFADNAYRLAPGRYDDMDLDRLGIMDNVVSSVLVPPGMSVILFEDAGFKGRAVYYTHDANTDSLNAKKFNNVTSSIQVSEEELPEVPVLKVTLYQDNFTGASKQLEAGSYDNAELGIGNNTLSAISIPRGLQVTLYENGAFEGRTLLLGKSAGPDVLNKYGFNDVTSSVKITEVNPDELVVTVYSDRFSGRGQQLQPGRYAARDLTIGDKALSSVKVPKGMRVTLFAEPNLTGVNVMLDRDEDFTGSKLFDNYYRSALVEDVGEIVLQGEPLPAPAVVTAPVVVQEPVKETVEQPVVAQNTLPPCELTNADDGLQAVRAKAFSQEKMEMAKLVTKDKCLTLDQVRGFAQAFDFEDQALEFVEYAYELSKDRDQYYKLESVFKFMSTQEKFRKFLGGK